MTREQTFNWLQQKIERHERVCVARYCDGEYLLMNGEDCASEDASIVGPLLRESIVRLGQLVCVNELKPHNINDIWSETQSYLTKTGQQSIYGGGNWHIYDYLRGSLILPYFFCRRTLIVGSLAQLIASILAAINPAIEHYQTESSKASHSYSVHLQKLRSMCASFDSIVFCCGPLGKVLLSNLINECNADLVDGGCLINALLDGCLSKRKYTRQWNMSWPKDKPLEQLSKSFLENLQQRIFHSKE